MEVAYTEVSDSGTGFVASITRFFQGILRNVRGARDPTPEMESEGADWSPSRTVLVVGATGKTGRLIVAELLGLGLRVVALVASDERAEEVRWHAVIGSGMWDRQPDRVAMDSCIQLVKYPSLYKHTRVPYLCSITQMFL